MSTKVDYGQVREIVEKAIQDEETWELATVFTKSLHGDEVCNIVAEQYQQAIEGANETIETYPLSVKEYLKLRIE